VEKIWGKIIGIFSDIPSFIERNCTNPVFWVILLVIIAGITFVGINKLGDK